MTRLLVFCAAAVAAVLLVWMASDPQGLSADRLWLELDPGLDLGTFRAGAKSDSDAAVIHVLRIEPKKFRLRLLNASAPGEGRPLTAREWCARAGLVAAINASMYQEDYRTSVSFMKTRDHTNNSRLSKDMSILAFDPLDGDVPEAQIIDRECQDYDALRGRYTSFVQSVRMVSCRRRNVWTAQPRRTSVAAVGTDDRGRILFLHAGTPMRTHDFVNAVLELPVGLERAMYAEGGSQAQLFVRAAGREFEFVGRRASGTVEGEAPVRAAPVPNVLGIERRSP